MGWLWKLSWDVLHLKILLQWVLHMSRCKVVSWGNGTRCPPQNGEEWLMVLPYLACIAWRLLFYVIFLCPLQRPLVHLQHVFGSCSWPCCADGFFAESSCLGWCLRFSSSHLPSPGDDRGGRASAQSHSQCGVLWFWGGAVGSGCWASLPEMQSR